MFCSAKSSIFKSLVFVTQNKGLNSPNSIDHNNSKLLADSRRESQLKIKASIRLAKPESVLLRTTGKVQYGVLQLRNFWRCVRHQLVIFKILRLSVACLLLTVPICLPVSLSCNSEKLAGCSSLSPIYLKKSLSISSRRVVLCE